ncbi:MAG: EAL domain-containing protein [Lachnospiraceae bacterium]
MKDTIILALVLLVFLSVLYWWLLFKLIEPILSGNKIKSKQSMLIGLFNTAIIFTAPMVMNTSNLPFYLMFVLMFLEFYIFLKHDFFDNLFCALACIIHVLIVHTMVVGMFAMAMNASVYQVFHITSSHCYSAVVDFIVLDIAIILVKKFISSEEIRIIMQHKEPRNFIIVWMGINGLYLLYDMDIICRPEVHENFSKNQVGIALTIAIGLYVLLFFAIQTVRLLGYKEKSTEMARTVEQLQRRVERDPLTGLYNKEITGNLVNEYLGSNPPPLGAVLFMIDVDNFKTINDQLSHAFGDAVLCELADKLHSIFRDDDIVGRIGGDEFIVCIKKVTSMKLAKEKAEAICKSFYVSYKGIQEEEYRISGSVGIAIAPNDGITFEELYNHADAALYQVKNNNKNGYKFYDGSKFLGYQSNRSEIYTEGSGIQKSFRNNRIEYVFKILYQSENYVEAIYSVLELVANHFSFERGYIFETNRDGKTSSNTFEWCAEGTTIQRQNLQNIPIDVLATANANFYKTGTYIVKSLKELNAQERAMLEPQGIKSMFQFGIFNRQQLLGFIGFDKCRSEAVLTNVELDEIATISSILATFFVKQRSDERTVKEEKVQQEIMNHLTNYIYVINPQTFQVLFMNEKISELWKNQDEDRPCYDFFRGRNQKCEDCPIKDLMENPENPVYKELYNEKLNIWVKTTASYLNWMDGSEVCLIESSDITKQKEENLDHVEQLEKLAFVDELTGSRSFYKFKEDARKILEEQRNQAHFLVKFDIDNFKLINQVYGYEKGDEVLQCIAAALEKTMQGEDEIFARISNDDFVALFANPDNLTIDAIHDAFFQNFYQMMSEDFPFKCTFPQGLYLIEPSESCEPIDVMDLFEKVNMAHKASKLDKYKKFVIYDESLTQNALRVKEVENKMVLALERNEFIIYLQPKYDLEKGTVGGAEALARWNNENHELFFPSAFITVFEKNGFITKLDFYVLEKVCQRIKKWIAEGIEPIVVSVNFSRLHLSNTNFVQELCEVVDQVGIQRKYIEIEITETAIYDNIDTLGTLLEDLHTCGFTMSMDDFGSGYSSLGMLKDLPVDIIKMDRSFFVNQKDAQRSKIVVGSIIEMASHLGARIVAEGVEEQEHIDLLRELHCDLVQGFYYAKPMPEEEFTALIQKNERYNA